MSRQFVTPQQTWDMRFMRLAKEAASWSKDPDEQVGSAVVAPDRRRVSFGYNGLPWGMPDEPELLCNRSAKNAFTIHAEQNAMANAPFDLEGWTLYSTKAPCLGCALIIRQRRIARVVSAPVRPDSRWADEQRSAAQMLEGLGLSVSWLQLQGDL